MHNVKELLDSVKAVTVGVKADPLISDKEFEVYRRLGDIVRDRHYWFYDKEGEDDKARADLQKLLAAIKKEFPVKNKAALWEKRFPDLFFCADSTEAELVYEMLGSHGLGNLLWPSLKLQDKIAKDKVSAEREKRVREMGEKGIPRRLRVSDKGSMNQEDYTECVKLLAPLTKLYDAAWAQWEAVKKVLEEGKEPPKELLDGHKKALEAYNKEKDKIAKGPMKQYLG